jgi:protein O-mannosyl-transferase
VDRRIRVGRLPRRAEARVVTNVRLSPLAARWLGTAALAALVAIAYGNTFLVPFVWDDIAEIERNPALDTLWPPTVPMFEGGRLPHRPLPYYTFALNRAFNRAVGLRPNDPRSFHALNLAIHLANTVLVWWLVARTLERLGRADGPAASACGWCAAAIWAAHPLCTQAVTYIYQRMESLAALGMLATLACFVAALDARRSRRWLAGSLGCAVLAMASKETAAVLPFVVPAYAVLVADADAGRRAAIVRGHRGFFACLCGTWAVVVAILVAQRGMYPELDRLGGERVSYALNQPLVILHYLRLAIWPWPLVFDTDWRRTLDPLPIAAGFAVVAAVLGWLVISWRRRPASAFLVLTFLLLLAPSSSILPASANRPCAEYRMYLALVPLVVGCVGGCLVAAGSSAHDRRAWMGAVAAAVAVATVLAIATHARNEAYATGPTLWADTLAKEPWNRRALGNLVSLLSREGRDDRILALYESLGESIADDVDSQARLTLILTRAGRTAEAAGVRERAVRLARDGVASDPKNDELWFHLGNLLRESSPGEAIDAFRRAARLDPRQADARANLGAMIARTAPEEAEALYREALAIDPTHPDAHANLGVLAARRGDVEAARRHLREALEHMPTHATARRNLELLSSP